MPIVPFSKAPIPGAPSPGRDPPSDAFALMAAAMMHSEGKFAQQPKAPSVDLNAHHAWLNDG